MADGLRRIIIDVTTSYRFFGRHAVGIVRVEREIIKAFAHSHVQCRFVRFDAGRKSFLSIPREFAVRLCDERGKHEPSVAAEQLAVFCFKDRDIFISAGLNWDNPYTHHIFNVKKSTKLTFVQILYDVAPTIMPEFCVPGMEDKFSRFLLDTIWTADYIFSISDHTSRDLTRFIRDNDLHEVAIRRIKMGTDLLAAPDLESLYGLKRGEFVVYVSSIEPRKNHITAFHVWRELLFDIEKATLPLVIVGKQQWNSSDLVTILKQSSVIYPDFLRILCDVDDIQLSWLYANAAFTIYPSLYEGWGLPITESLAQGTPCICSDSSSMPEAAQGFCELLSPLDQPSWKRACKDYMLDQSLVDHKRRDIRTHFRPVTWHRAMTAFVNDILEIGRSDDVQKVHDFQHLPRH